VSRAVKERYVRFRLFHWFVPATDPVTLQEIMVERYATHGMKVSTAEHGDEPHTAYGLPEERLRWGDLNGAFFSEAEVKAMEAGVTDTQLPMESQAEPRGDVGTTVSGTTSLAQATEIAPPAVHPLAFEEMNIMQLAEVFKDISTDEILEIAAATPSTAEFVYSAAVMAHGGVAPEGLTEGIAEIMGRGVADPGLTGRGVEYDGEETEDGGPTQEGATVPEESEDETPPGDPETPEGTAGDGGDGGQEPPPAGPDPSDAAVALAKEKGVDLADVKGTGKDDRVTQADVQKYLAEKEGQS
jgi:pyruvate/2-oxoglutarate dehydrogenase complex dihydrolipoamide acyltransferase (E2) component